MITIESLIRTASGMASGVIAVAAAHDEEVLKAVCEAKRKNIANAILVGNVIRIKSILSELGEEQSGFELIPADSDADCAAKAVSAVRSGRANLLMKGILNTADLMRAVLDKENGIRTHVLGKISDGSDEIPNALRQGHIAYVINTRDPGSSGRDGIKIRRIATEHNVTLFTALDTIRVLLDVLEETTLTISTIDA